jgi:hypothetical protein
VVEACVQERLLLHVMGAGEEVRASTKGDVEWGRWTGRAFHMTLCVPCAWQRTNVGGCLCGRVGGAACKGDGTSETTTGSGCVGRVTTCQLCTRAWRRPW